MATNVSNRVEKINLDHLLIENLELGSHSSIQCGGNAQWAAYPANFEELRFLITYARNNDLPLSILGGATNTLISDNGVEGLVILTNHLASRHVMGEMFCVRSGCPLEHAISQAIEDGLEGLEMLGGIPGSVGGAIYGNSGANGVQIGDLLYYVDYMTLDGKLHRMQIHHDEFSYRQSPFTGRDDLIIYEAGFRLKPTTQTSEIRKRKDTIKKHRKQKGLYDYPSLGSIFKNPAGKKAAALIDACALKGHTIGGASISPTHANIIINKEGKATSADVRALIEYIKTTVQKELHITLEEEIQYLGHW
ncbi:UDP-N-acetylmuramate dehydrogenase [Sphaerochaeta halotolerans]|jgi:UDP-N-acetylmuramate dehydrogenase|uniref:UDP-N-acetylenolpyruvoylglucosamine reductase n=1 Tax=Sphaerochaeta halotolerans TaxID=2293840 RepID=A0A372MHB4_9SPIR|nr:UDP-N-acetylmuramate dehydrogenase [Sphaerochaeta halotolerans]MBG0766111.1 UDP-N-acetylmuramate dehydrogenase [Spirochaetaceae bacterium]MDK2859028.1 UDP-N-acetylmuramate dehydrogenase [Sphaerochaeta sp.]MDN5333223.1 UDP-N-acetylmuramate dehydrogenase [Sphaerochaeta sp.]MXI85502.1 UDP-N-acetylmuramate dehydrogenase [Sphaerochaeta halotolerans]RFU95169.1 UDP-N-acetylmuramate dehydrogenase [Sphaerochaeta halotolerans]